MIYILTGTKAQLIKMAPVIHEIRQRGLPITTIDTAQHASTTRGLIQSLHLDPPDLRLSQRSGDVASYWAAIRWLVADIMPTWLRRRHLRARLFPNPGVCLVHGDTLSTLIGVMLARRARVPVCHVEAGLRSWSLRDPFPEELIRIWCMRRSELLLAPSTEARENLERMGLAERCVALEGNTGADALRLVLGSTRLEPPDVPYVVATCHRLETISSRSRLAAVLDLVNRVARKTRVIFVEHPPTAHSLRKFGLAERLDASVERIPLLDYPDFARLLVRSSGVLTDGGSIQEECALVGIPCLVLRQRSERPDGVESGHVRLWRFSDAAEAWFLERALSSRKFVLLPDRSPSKAAVDAIVAYFGNLVSTH